MSRPRGFTLLEILLVLVLLAVASVAVIGTLPSNASDVAKQQAQSFFQRIQLLNEEALLSGKEFGLRVDDKKSRYTLMQLGDNGWEELSLNDIPAITELSDGVVMQFDLGSSAWQDKDRLFDPNESLFDDDRFADEKQQKTLPAPQVLITSSGEITAFTLSLHLAHQGANDGWRIITRENGDIVILAPGERDEQAKL